MRAATGRLEGPAPRFERPTPIRLTLMQLASLVRYTLRESLHRWTLVASLIGVSFFLLLLATAVNLDIVEGTLASARLFGQDLTLQEYGIQIRDVVRTFQVAIITLLYVVGVALALFATSNLVPQLLAEGWVDLLVAQPITRHNLLLGRSLGAITVVALNVSYLIVGSWLVLRWKTGFGNAGFLIAGLFILVAYAACYAAMVLVGVVTRNSPVCSLVGLFVWLGGHILYPFHHFEGWRAALTAGWPRNTAVAITETLYWVLPKSQGLGEAAVAAARGGSFSLGAVWGSLPFAVGAIALACWWFSRRDY